MQAVLETLFDVTYLVSILVLGFTILKKSKGNKNHLLFGVMAVTLGIGDSFHLVPRVYAFWTTGLQENVFALGIGKFMTSITMTIFYIILYQIYRTRYQKQHKKLTPIFYALAFSRVVLCMMPQNNWTSAEMPFSWGIYRNIPFLFMGIIIIILFYKVRNRPDATAFRNMYLAIFLSFAFYVPVVLFATVFPPVGMLMIPKTLAYVWVVYMGYNDIKK